MLYLIHNEDVSPDACRSDARAEALTVSREPGQANLSHEPRELGWLGTTNGMDEHALGAFEDNDIEGLVAAIEEEGFYADAAALADWVRAGAVLDYEVDQLMPEIHGGVAVQFTVEYDEDGSDTIPERTIADGYVILDEEADGYGNYSSTHTREDWERQLTRHGIWYEIDSWESFGGSGYAGWWYVACRAEDEERAWAAMIED